MFEQLAQTCIAMHAAPQDVLPEKMQVLLCNHGNALTAMPALLDRQHRLCAMIELQRMKNTNNAYWASGVCGRAPDPNNTSSNSCQVSSRVTMLQDRIIGHISKQSPGPVFSLRSHSSRPICIVLITAAACCILRRRYCPRCAGIQIPIRT